MIDERPGTSFTSKRQVQTEQRKRQLNVGTLETEDKSTLDLHKKSRPITQDNLRAHPNSRMDKRARNVPLSILQDRESLYEEVINAKQINNRLQEEKIALQTRLKQMQEELTRVMKQAPSNDSLINPMESYYQEPKPQKGSLLVDLKRQVRKLQEELRHKEAELQLLKKNSRVLKAKELEMELIQYQKETVRLRAIIQEQNRWDDPTLDRLGALQAQLQEQQTELAGLQEELRCQKVKSREHESKMNKYMNANIRKNKLIAHLKEVIESLKFKDPELKRQNKASETEEQLKSEMIQKNKQIDQLINSLKIKDNQYADLDRRMKDLEITHQTSVEKLQDDNRFLKEQYNQLKEEVAQQSGRRRTMQSSFMIDKHLEVLPEGPEINDQKNKKMLVCIQKDDVAIIGKTLRMQLRLSRIPFEQVDKLIFNDDEMHTISLEELQDLLQNQPFLLSDEESLKVARYLVEDNDEKYVEFSPNAQATIPRVRSILRNLIGHYSLLEKAEEQQIFQEIAAILTKYRNSLEDYILKVKKRPEFCSVEDLEDALKFVEQSLNSQQYDYLMLRNFEFTQRLTEVDYKKLLANFHFVLEPAPVPQLHINEPQKENHIFEQPPNLLLNQRNKDENSNRQSRPSQDQIPQSQSIHVTSIPADQKSQSEASPKGSDRKQIHFMQVVSKVDERNESTPQETQRDQMSDRRKAPIEEEEYEPEDPRDQVLEEGGAKGGGRGSEDRFSEDEERYLDEKQEEQEEGDGGREGEDEGEEEENQGEGDGQPGRAGVEDEENQEQEYENYEDQNEDQNEERREFEQNSDQENNYEDGEFEQ